MFWSMQGLITADSFGRYRLELTVDLTEEEGDRMVHELAGLGDRVESPPVNYYYWRGARKVSKGSRSEGHGTFRLCCEGRE